jgi:hypothetical protein
MLVDTVQTYDIKQKPKQKKEHKKTQQIKKLVRKQRKNKIHEINKETREFLIKKSLNQKVKSELEKFQKYLII